MSQPSSFWWQKYGTLAQMAQAAVALLGFVAILFQINEIRSNNRAASARQVFLGYTDLAFRNPKFSAPDYDTIKAGSREEQVQYESFVSYFLYACEEATAAFADRRDAFDNQTLGIGDWQQRAIEGEAIVAELRHYASPRGNSLAGLPIWSSAAIMATRASGRSGAVAFQSR